MIEDTLIFPGLSPVCGLDIHARFDGGTMSSSGGALLLREAGRVLVSLLEAVYESGSFDDLGQMRKAAHPPPAFLGVLAQLILIAALQSAHSPQIL